jgi:CheY-like chemotaxis protein
LRETVEETAFLLAPLAFEKKLELITFIDKDVPEEVIGDQARLKQVLINLIENAIKFTGEGEIFIKVNNMNCGNATEPAIIQFEVQDTGIGIDRNDLEKLFLPFSQLDSSLTRRYGGTGLGLAISKRLIEMMGGKICLESEKAKGTKFSFSVHFKQTEKIEPFQKFDDKLLNVPVLIVENNATQCQVLRQYLNEAGCEVVTTPHYQTALEMLTAANSRRYRFILVASQLINSGQQTLADVISSPSGLEPCDLIILISSNNYPDQTGLPVKSGEPNSYMTLNKPVKKAQLLACLSGKLTSQVLSVSEAKPLPVTQNYTFNDFTILVVEDNELNRKLMLKLLNKWGYRCEIAKNGHEAFLACQTKKYNLILMDCQMPVMDGYEAATAIRKTEGINKHTVIIGVTAHALSSDRQKCLSAGMDDYISKPFDYIKLAEMLEKYKNAS